MQIEQTLDTVRGIVGGLAEADLAHNNANKASEQIPVMRDMVAGEVSKYIGLNEILPPLVSKAHKDGWLHYHDLDYSPLFPMFNCMLIDVEGMLRNGFRMGAAEIVSPKSIMTACNVTAQIIAQVASHIYGGNTINRIDEVLAPYVTLTHKKHYNRGLKWFEGDEQKAQAYADELTEKETYDAFQSLEYEINTLHTANGQTPFTTLGFGLGTSWESRLIQKAILKVRMDGLGKRGKTAVFPKLVYAIKKGHNRAPGDINYDIKKLAVKCATERMYPDIVNYDKVVEITGDFKFPMGCRSFLHEYQGEIDGRNNLGVVTLNLPRVALDACGDERVFWDKLDERLELCKQALMNRIDRLRGVKAKVAPILYIEGACGMRLCPDDDIMQVFENGRASISLGYIGIHETLQALRGNDSHPFDDVSKQQLGLDIVKHMATKCQQWTEETGFAFSLYGTPAESLCGRFCKLDEAVHGTIEGVTDHGYYTNSFHLDVRYKTNPYYKILFEAPFPKHSKGGFICYAEYPNLLHNPEALEDVWDFSYDHIPYLGTNTPIDECYECGFQGEFKCTSKGFECPSCGNHNPQKVSVTRRVCGYLGSPDARPFNLGKQAEVINRIKHLE
jgi:ribonucleoside-triphosphate reductase